jgi:Zn-dependent peptidase ImmA (M78 family)
VEKLAEGMGAIIHYEPFQGQMSAMVSRQANGVAIIGVNAMHSETRRRFSIAHELGHLAMHQSEDFHIDERYPIDFRAELSSMGTDDREIEANQFAAELLMPRNMIVAAFADLPPHIDSDDAVERLADQFKVSTQAMTIRLSALGLLS